MTNPENLPIKIATRDVVVPLQKSGSLVARGLVAIQNSKGLDSTKNNDELYRQARTIFDQAEVESDYSIMDWGEKRDARDARYNIERKFLGSSPTLFSAFNIFKKLASKNYGKALYPLSILSGGHELDDFLDNDEAARLRRVPLGTEHRHEQLNELFKNRSRYLAQPAFEWCFANQTNVDVELWCDLGDMYFAGHGVTLDRVQAAIWFRKAAEQGHVKAQYRMGCCFSWDETEEGQAEAAQWYLMAAKQGDATAQFNLGLCYQYGEGLTRAYAKAAKWYIKAAKQGHNGAQVQLRHISSWHKSSVTAVDATTERWDLSLLKAANQGGADAQYIIGNLYSMGWGATQNDAKAAQWYCKAAKQGHEDAQIELRNLGIDWNTN